MPTEKRKHFHLNYKIKDFITMLILLLGIVSLSVFLYLMQSYTTEQTQKKSSTMILEEVAKTMAENNNTVLEIEREFNAINQSTANTVAAYLKFADILAPLEGKENLTVEETEEALSSTNKLLEEFKENGTTSGRVHLVDETGRILISNEPLLRGQDLFEFLNKSQIERLTAYKLNPDGTEKYNGTQDNQYGKATYNPVIYKGYFIFSSYVGTQNGHNYFILQTASSDIFNTELDAIRKVDQWLSGITVGKDGFLFAVDTDTGKFLYFDDGTNDLTGNFYKKYGVTDAIAQDKYAGYQTILGTNYYCVSKNISSKTYGNYTIIAAAVSKTSLIDKNRNTVFFSCLGFALVAFIVCCYGIILKRETANGLIQRHKKYLNQYKLELENNPDKYTESEIRERSLLLLQNAIDRQKDKRFERIFIGNRDSEGRQIYFSTYVTKKLTPIFAIGLLLVFLVSFFSQTLLALQDATTASVTRMNDVREMIEKNANANEGVDNYISGQCLEKTKLITNLLEESPTAVFSYDKYDENVHQVFEKDADGKRIYEVDQYGNPVYCINNSPALAPLCEENGLRSMMIFNENGKAIASSTNAWLETLTAPELIDVLDGVTNETTIRNTRTDSFITTVGNVFYYYTFQGNNGKTYYASHDDFELFRTGSWKGPEITKHRGVMVVTIDEAPIQEVFKITSIDYILVDLYVYGENSFFVAFDTSDEHRVIYAPNAESIGKTAEELGISDSSFKIGETYNGFQKVNGITYYQTCTQIGDYYIATEIPLLSLYSNRDALSSWTTLFSAVFIFIAMFILSISSDRNDQEYVNDINILKGEAPTYETFDIKMPSGNQMRTDSIASRFAKTKWIEKSPEQKLETLILGCMTVTSVLILIAIVRMITNAGDNTIINYILKGDWERGLNVFALTESLMVWITVLTVTKLFQICVKAFCGALGSRAETTGDLIASVLKYGGIIGVLFYTLYLFGFDTTSLLTSASILSIVIGLGAQSLISDIIAGIFIVFEGEFRVGDIVTIGDFRGQVLEIGLRTTKIQDTSKYIKIFNNSDISGVLNMTKEASITKVIMSISYEESLDKVEKLAKKNLPLIKKRIPEIIDGPWYKGITELADSSVDLLFLASCNENDRFTVERALRKELYILFNNNHINVPYNQLTLSYLDETYPKETQDSKEKKEEKLEKLMGRGETK